MTYYLRLLDAWITTQRVNNSLDEKNLFSQLDTQRTRIWNEARDNVELRLQPVLGLIQLRKLACFPVAREQVTKGWGRESSWKGRWDFRGAVGSLWDIYLQFSKETFLFADTINIWLKPGSSLNGFFHS